MLRLLNFNFYICKLGNQTVLRPSSILRQFHTRQNYTERTFRLLLCQILNCLRSPALVVWTDPLNKIEINGEWAGAIARTVPGAIVGRLLRCNRMRKRPRWRPKQKEDLTATATRPFRSTDAYFRRNIDSDTIWDTVSRPAVLPGRFSLP